MSNYLNDLSKYLTDQGLVGSSTDFHITVGRLAARQDRNVVLYPHAGLPPQRRPGLDFAGLQVRVRGDKKPEGYDAAFSKCFEINSCLLAIRDTKGILWIQTDQSSPHNIGQDDQSRPEFTWNYIVVRCR